MQTAEIEFIKNLKNQLQQELPGISSQVKMAPPYRSTQVIDENLTSSATHAGVLLCLFFKSGIPHCILISRPSDMTIHAGQVAIPGGRRETSDANILETAIREADEEIGLRAGQYEVLGKLTELYIPVSNYLVFPYVAFSLDRPVYKIDSREVGEVLEVSMNSLLVPESVESMSSSKSPGPIPIFRHEEHIIWGATAMILSEFTDVCRAFGSLPAST